MGFLSRLKRLCLPGASGGLKRHLNEFRNAAEQGDAAAQCDFGLCYYKGDGVEQDRREAVKWFRKAAEQGHAGAQRILGLCYRNGIGVEQDRREALKWYRKGAEQETQPAAMRKHEQSPDAGRKTQEIINRPESEHAAVKPICEAILVAAWACADALKPKIQFSDEKDRTAAEVLVRFEFLYFFMHMACRLMYERGEAMRNRLQEIMVPALVSIVIETMFGQWPQKDKDRMQSDFYDDLDDAEFRYGSCKEWFSMADDGLFKMLSENVTKLCGRDISVPMRMNIIGRAAHAVSTDPGLIRIVGGAGTF